MAASVISSFLEGKLGAELAAEQHEVVDYVASVAEDLSGDDPAERLEHAENLKETMQGFFETLDVTVAEVEQLMRQIQKRRFVLGPNAEFHPSKAEVEADARARAAAAEAAAMADEPAPPSPELAHLMEVFPGSDKDELERCLAKAKGDVEAATQEVLAVLEKRSNKKGKRQKRKQQQHQSRTSTEGDPDEGKGESVEECKAGDKQRAFEEQVSSLVQLCPDDSGLNREHVEYLLSMTCMGDFEDATSALLDNVVSAPSAERRQQYCANLVFNTTKWRDAQRKASEDRERQDSEGQRTVLLDRFAEQLDDSRKTHRPVAVWDQAPKVKGQTHFRYLDGKKIAMKSGADKFVVVDQKPEWDGGSKGIVMTKGKRGPGMYRT